MLFISVIKAVFPASLLQSSVSYDPSEIILRCWFAAQETLLIITNVKKRFVANILWKEHELCVKINKSVE